MKIINFKKVTVISSVLAVIMICFAFMTPKTISVKGSDTLVILSQKWAEVYMKSHPNINIQVTGGGSGVGISALINGTTDICNASRRMKESEIEKLKEKYKTPGVEIPCAKDGITIYVNKTNKINELTIDQLSKIYLGKVTNWKDVGGANVEIRLYGRENSSGTYEYFKEDVVKGDYAANCQTLPGTAAVVNAVIKDVNGIGYGGAAYAKNIKIIKVKKDSKSIAYAANAKTIKDGTYPISRYLYMYVINRPTGDIKNYIDWILGAEGQKYVTEIGYFPVK